MRYFCESGKHLLFDSDAQHTCGSRADLERLIRNQRVMQKEIKVCMKHPRNDGKRCLSCNFAIDWNVCRKYCIRCGEPATGYRTMKADEPVEFFCDAHWEDVPAEATA